MKALISVALTGSMALGVAGEPIVASPMWQDANYAAKGDQDSPSIATNRYGHVGVVWEHDQDTDYASNVHSDVFYRLFRLGTPVCEIKLSAGGTSGANWRHIMPDVGLDDSGNAVVVWAHDPDGNGFFNVAYRVLNTSCDVTGSGYANSDHAGQQINPRVAVDPDGSPKGGKTAFTVVWEDIQGSNPATIKAARYSDPATRAYEVTASQPGGQHHQPDVAVTAGGDAWVVWDEDANADGDYNIGRVNLSRLGSVIGTHGVANENVAGQQTSPSIAATYAGRFAVTWQSDHGGAAGVWARSFQLSGSPSHSEVEVAGGGLTPRVGLDEQGGVVVAWTAQASDLDVWVRGFNPDGSPAGRLEVQRLSLATAGKQEQLTVAVSPYGEVGVAYTDDADGNTGDQIILGVGIFNTSW
ncbi:hypothetical protein [Catelliglobosispora koreensis]|uniref:hypothetical protein n=1 Tax=Catelliglobosispora koreensis TaxID=129052 RepID=UPI0004757BB7|nr:hypothetical protein [Catelliglobosispora koreensis]